MSEKAQLPQQHSFQSVPPRPKTKTQCFDYLSRQDNSSLPWKSLGGISRFDAFKFLPMVCFCFPGTAKVKSSSIQVGDLIIVEKVCWRLSYPYVWASWLSSTLNVPLMCPRIKREAVSLFYSAGEKDVSKDFVILGSMLRLSLSYLMCTKPKKSLMKSLMQIRLSLPSALSFPSAFLC